MDRQEKVGFCSRCLLVDHDTSDRDDCNVQNWSPHNQQVSDRCKNTGHEASKCEKRKKLQMRFGICGHEGDHRDKTCPIRNTEIQSNVDQYTESR